MHTGALTVIARLSAAAALTVVAAATLTVVAAAALTVVAAARPRWRHQLPKVVGLAAGGVLAVYLVGRGVAEFFIIHYGDPASYRDSWGGPSLVGVFGVHSGPAVAILLGAGAYLIRRHRAGRVTPGSDRSGRVPSGPGPSGRDEACDVRPFVRTGGAR